MTAPPENRISLGRLATSVVLVSAIPVISALHRTIKDAVVPWDSKNQFYAFFRFLSETLHSGAWPFWNPYHYGGHPSAADPQSLIFAPVFIVWAAIARFPTMRAFDMVVQAHLLIGGLAVVFIGWRARWPSASIVLAATIFMLGGPASGRLQHTGIILSYSAFPLALLLLHLALERRSYGLAVAFAVVAAAMALGRNQVALLLCALLVAAAVAETISAHSLARYLRERVGVLTVMTVVGAALLVIPLLLTMQFAILSNRPNEGLSDALRGSLYPANFANVAVPNIFGTHSAYWGPGAATLADVDLTDDSENYLFLGSVPTLLLLWFGVAGHRAWEIGRRLMAGALAIACLFMLGRYTPFYGTAFSFVPGIDLFRRPTDASFIFVIATAFIVGHCLADYVRIGLPKLRPWSALLAVAAFFAAIASAIVFSARTGHGAEAGREALISLTLMLAAGAALLSMRREATRPFAAWLLVLAGVSELMWWNTASRLNAEPWSVYAVLEAPSGPDAEAIRLLERSLAADRRRGEYPRIEVLGLGGPWQNLAMVRGWEAINGYNPLRIGAYDRLVSPGEQNWNVSLRQFPPSFDNYDCSLAKALGLTYLVLGSPLRSLPGLSAVPASELLLSGPPIWIYRIPGALPRVSLVSELDQRLPSRSEDSNTSFAKIASSAPGRLDVVTTSQTAKFLLVHDLYYPGWVAEVDGQERPILRAAQLFLAVEVPSGTHRVSIHFAPFTPQNLANALATVFASGHGTTSTE
ncbi:MAG TPA: YfhO family protein [Bradyrhizobium sp.]|uniref:YfhO family protein n=1 Tax=Bradyrhizobium sp. TaxID=376 RepID=UPI002D7E9DBD|nr:YfhO family protein [Bradyrhizobium sp.]HET7887585.1 YfhO family protein [Bradyrhizobium sp.]